MGQGATVLELMLEPENIEIAKSIFKKYDTDGSGQLDKEEFSKFILDLFNSFENSWTEKDTPENSSTFQKLSKFETYDKDHDGTISFNEFVQTIKANKFSL
jgi:Ca2+-binding EF-hand superfamily protein